MQTSLSRLQVLAYFIVLYFNQQGVNLIFFFKLLNSVILITGFLMKTDG